MADSYPESTDEMTGSSVPCETNFRQQCQPDEEKNWERQFLALLTPALMGVTRFRFRVQTFTAGARHDKIAGSRCRESCRFCSLWSPWPARPRANPSSWSLTSPRCIARDTFDWALRTTSGSPLFHSG